MATGEPMHNLVIHYDTKRYSIKNVQSDTYTHLQLLSDVSDLALRDIPSNVNVYITLNLPIPGTSLTMEVQNDCDMKTMFELYMRTENVHILLMVSENPPLSAPSSGPHPNWLTLDDSRKKGKKVIQAEDDPEVKNMKAMADVLLSQIKRTDVGCDFKRDMRMRRAAILKRVSRAKQEKVHSMAEPVGDNVGL